MYANTKLPDPCDVRLANSFRYSTFIPRGSRLSQEISHRDHAIPKGQNTDGYDAVAQSLS
jgi:hypothetical protein